MTHTRLSLCKVSVRHAARTRALLGVALAAVAALLAACGSKPAFCSHVSELEKSLQALGSLNAQSGVKGLEEALKKVNTSVETVVSSAKSEFPTQTGALESSLKSLDTTVREVSTATSTSARNAAIAKLPGDVSAVEAAATEFETATKEKCK